jgi:ABC-type nitrate/sulfonate/bicarbonate transport system ATPase subunit
MIRFQGVSKSFNKLKILEEVFFEIKAHEVVGIQGSSGSGKTTLLRLIAGILKPDMGMVQVSTSKIGFIFQDHRLLPWRTAEDNISLVLQASGVNDSESHEKARLWMDRLGLKGFYGYYPAQLSGGMVQRVTIARAFAIEPELMLMDEPFNSLDAEMTSVLLKELHKVLREYKTTAVYVSHNRLEVISIADRIFELADGEVKESVISDRPTMVREYLSSRLKEIIPEID